MSYIQKYPTSPPLSRIPLHNQLIVGASEIGSFNDNNATNKKLYTFVKKNGHLSLLVSYVIPLKTGDKYYCDQFDFPLKVLSWFPKALEEFRKPPAEGGLHAGAMTSADVDVDGEMLCVQNATEGYYLVNRSRSDHDAAENSYVPTEISLSYNFLYNLGFLDFWKILGEKYEKGLL